MKSSPHRNDLDLKCHTLQFSSGQRAELLTKQLGCKLQVGDSLSTPPSQPTPSTPTSPQIPSPQLPWQRSGKAAPSLPQLWRHPLLRFLSASKERSVPGEDGRAKCEKQQICNVTQIRHKNERKRQQSDTTEWQEGLEDHDGGRREPRLKRIAGRRRDDQRD